MSKNSNSAAITFRAIGVSSLVLGALAIALSWLESSIESEQAIDLPVSDQYFVVVGWSMPAALIFGGAILILFSGGLGRLVAGNSDT